ncbi:hypothetical protein WMY93_023409 [Mugilogobius chulae]|uniref:Uncharacterized protein n=1 Tax=Mugilogobius chulae TaxID=88201 RepID=A0AAW0N5A5_9GOBI
MPVKLRIILKPDDTRKLLLRDGIPNTMEQLMDEVRKDELEDLSTIKVIPTSDECSQRSDVIVLEDAQSPLSLSWHSDDTEILSSPSSSVSTRSEMWPREFPIPKFSYDTELQLEKGNAEYRANKTRFEHSTKTKSDILEKVAEEIFKFKAYPTDADYSEVAEALIKKHPCLSEPGSYNGCYGWKQRLKTKMGNYRTQLKGSGCSELLVNSLKSKTPEDALPAKNVKRPRRGEANHIPDLPTGETQEKLENERLSLLTDVMKRDNRAVIKDKMAKTFSLRRREIVEKELGVEELRERWPALFTVDETRFLASLDKHYSKLIELIRRKAGVIREKTQEILKVLDLSSNIKRECLLKCLILYLGEDPNQMIKEYLRAGRMQSSAGGYYEETEMRQETALIGNKTAWLPCDRNMTAADKYTLEIKPTPYRSKCIGGWDKTNKEEKHPESRKYVPLKIPGAGLWSSRVAKVSVSGSRGMDCLGANMDVEAAADTFVHGTVLKRDEERRQGGTRKHNEPQKQVNK